MHVFGKAAAKDLDYSQGLNFILPSFLPFLPWKWKLSIKSACSAPEVYKSAFLGQMALERRRGTPATAGTCSWELGSLSLYVAGHRQWCSASFAHGVLATWGACFGTTELHFVDTPSSY